MSPLYSYRRFESDAPWHLRGWAGRYTRFMPRVVFVHAYFWRIDHGDWYKT